MFAVYAEHPDPTDPLAALRLGERPAPEPPPGWVAVDVVAARLNMHDIWTLRGAGVKAEQFPMILGCDGVGRLADGRQVLIYPIVNGADWRGDETLDPQRTLLTELHQGTFAERVIVPARNVIDLPTGLSVTHAATLGTAWLTAYRMLFTKSGLKPGQTMLVQGATGGVSTALIQLGRAAGMTVWVTGRDDAKRAAAARLGAHAAFEPGARLPERVDAVFESVGEVTWAHSMRSVRPGGTIICCGATTGQNPGADLQRLFFLQLRVEGSTMGSRQELVDLVRFVSQAHIEPEIAMVLPLDAAVTGVEAMLAGTAAGKIVFDIGAR